MDDSNYKLFQSGKVATCAGQSPPAHRHRIIAPQTNHWNIVLTYEGETMTLLDYEIGIKDIRLT
jgi:hypothetical protein